MAAQKRDLWRFRLNWIFIIIIAPLYTISLYGVSSSFHQFVTNPTLQQIRAKNHTNITLEPGLGETEAFYSVLVSAAYVGATIGGILSGILTRYVPYWYQFMFCLTTHVLGYVIYSVAYRGWLILISRLLSGYLTGGVVSLAFNYFTTSSEQYTQVRRELGMNVGEKDAFRLRNYLFGIVSIGYSSGLILGSGPATIFALFKEVNQFRAIGWYNVAYGVVGIILQLLMFHGEIKCLNQERCLQVCQKKKKTKAEKHEKLSFLSLFIILSLLAFSFMERIRFTYVQTLFNPIASDSFGIDERGAAYFFLSLSIPQILGSLMLPVLHRLHITSQGIALFAGITTMLGYVFVTDWQTIPYDPCTEYSPYHHPDLVELLNTSLAMNGTLQSPRMSHDLLGGINPTLTSTRTLDLMFENGDKISFGEFSTVFNCRYVQSCQPGLIRVKLLGDSKHHEYQCHPSTNTTEVTEFCFYLSKNNQVTAPQLDQASDDQEIAGVQVITVLPPNLYVKAKNECETAEVVGHSCHWIPSSSILHKECGDCQPICRSVDRTLTFPQFLIGNSLLVFSSAIQIVSLASLLMNQSPEHLQGIVIGSMTALNAISNTFSPVLLDGIYEVMAKRNFLPSIIIALIHVPFILEIAVLYPRLGPRKKHKYSELDQSDDDSEQDIKHVGEF